MSSEARQTASKDLFIHELQELVATSTPETECVQVNYDGTPVGLVDAKLLRELALVYEEECELLTVKRPSESKPVALYEHPLFQRRRPQLVQASTLSETTEQYFVMKKEATLGPLTREELIQEIKEAHVLPTDLISNDQGLSWNKLYTYNEFDRRSYVQGQLPSGPDLEDLEVLQSLSENHAVEESETEAIAGLAFLGNLQRGKGHEISKNSYAGDVTDPNRVNPLRADENFQYYWVALFFLSLAGLAMVILTWNSSTPPVEQTAAQARQEAIRESQAGPVQRLQGTPIPSQQRGARPPERPSGQIERSRGQAARTGRAIQPRRVGASAPSARSFAESSSFRRAMDHDESNENYDDYDRDLYDDATDPYEQDPVRSRVSRETLDPDGDLDNWASALTRAPAYDDAEMYDEDEPIDLFDDY
jgi:hypothetical protein